MTKRNLFLANEDLLQKLYHQDKMSLKEIGEYLGGWNHVTVLNRMKKFNIPLRSSAQASAGEFNKHRGKTGGKRRYFINEKAFEILSPEIFWCLGFISADGCIENNSDYSICQAEKEPLEKIKQIIEYDKPIEKRIQKSYGNNDREIYRLRVSCVKHVNFFKSYGIIKKKSLTLKFPPIPDNYFWDFVRGNFDGDGSIYLIKNYPRIKFSGSVFFIEFLRDIICNKLNISKPSIDYYKNIAQIVFCSKAKTVADHIYMTSQESCRLNRKHEKYLTYFKGV